MPGTRYAKSQKFASLSSEERARRVAKIRDPRKRKQAEKFWGVERDRGGFLGGLVEAGLAPTKIARNLVGDVPQFAEATYASGEQIAGALKSDIQSGRGLWKPGGLAYGESKTGALALEMAKGIPGQAKLLADPKAWYEDPGIQMLNLAAFALPPLRAANIARLSQSLRAANPGMSRAQATKLATAESFNPGFAAARGKKGGIAPRLIKGKYGPEEGVRGRMPSRQPVIRAAQRAWDRGAERIDVTAPGSRWSSSAKAQRMASRQTRAAVQLQKAKRRQLEGKVVEGLLGPGLTAKIRTAFDRPGRTDRPRAAALVAGLEAPGNLTVRRAAELAIEGKRHTLEENGELARIEAGAEDLRRQRSAALEADPDVDTTPLDNEIAKREGQLDVLLGRAVPALDSPNRTKVYNQMVSTIGRNAADDQIQQWDLAAWGNDLENPTAFYDKVEVQRLADPETFRPAAGAAGALYQRMAGEQGRFFFPLQRALRGMGDQPIPVGSFRKRLAKAGVNKEELQNSGLESILTQLERGTNPTVNPADVLDDLGAEGYFERFDPDIVMRTDEGRGTYDSETRWGPEDTKWGPVLNSREGEPGEYFEFVVDYPELPGVAGGAGVIHWRKPSSVYHVRGQIFYEDNVRKMLIEEIQSDWASDVRRAKSEVKKTEAELAGAREQLAEATEKLNEVLARARKGGDFTEELRVAKGTARFLTDRVRYLENDLQWHMPDVPPSPMHAERYVNNAIHQIMRKADEQNVDEIILTSGNTQLFRNGGVNVENIPSAELPRRYIGPPGEERPYDYSQFYDWDEDRPFTNEQLDKSLDDVVDRDDPFIRLYERDYPRAFKKLYGLEGEMWADAYQGRFSAQPERGADPEFGGYYQEDVGDMPGTVIRVTPEARRIAREQEHALYQRAPDDGTPLGATEFLANGNRRVTMFKGANATTWSHELIHVLTPDLTPEHRAILEREIAGGKPYEEWGTTEHEALAKAWDTYWRDGYAPPSLREVFADLIKRMKRLWKETSAEAHTINRQTAKTFDEMLGKRYQNTVVLDRKQVNQVEADIADLQKAIDSGDVDQMDEALNALAELAHQAEEAGVAILTRGKKPAQVEAILEGLATRKNAVVEDYRRRGLIDGAEEARGYFPHMSMWEAIGEPPSDPVRMAATGDVVGTPKVQAKTVNRNRNRLYRHQTGEVLNDPVVVTYILRARLRLLETIRARTELYAVADPIEPGRPIQRDMVYVRNPEVEPEKMRTATLAANRLSERDFRELSARQLADEIDELNDVDGIEGQMFWRFGEGERPDWVTKEDNVRVVPRRVAQNRLGDVFRAAPKGNLAAAVGVTNALFRIASIYLRPWRYIPVNYTQNAIMLALTNPAAFTKLVKRDVARLTKDDPQLRDMIRDQVGTIQATALPEFNIRPQAKLQGLERTLTQGSGQFGEMLGRYADVPIREAAWLNHAGKYGFVDADDVRRLIEDPDLAEVREIVSQRTKEDLIDFDALTPYEREVMTRYLALWPFIRGITKWPFMYAREYPMRVAAASLASGAVNQEETDRSVLDIGTREILGKRINIGKLDPTSPGREMVQNAVALMRGAGKVAQGEAPDLTAFSGNYLTPGLREVIGMASGDVRKNWTQNVGRTFVPGVGIGLDVGKGGSLSDQALRQMGLVRERTDGVKREVKSWMAPIDQLTKQIRDSGRTPPPVLIEAQKLRAPYGDWKQYEAERKFAKRDQGLGDNLTPSERVEGLIDVAKSYYPALYAQATQAAEANGWQSFEQMLDAGTSSNEFLKEVDDYLYEQMFGAMADIKRQAKEAGLTVE